MKAIENLRNSRFVCVCVKPVYFFFAHQREKLLIREEIRRLKVLRRGEKYIFHLGIPTSTNLGDLAQYYLIRKWFSFEFPDYHVVSFSSRAILYHNSEFLDILSSIISKEDYIVFQSGYNTHDLGGYEDQMHREVIRRFSDQKIIMMPQTVYFKSEERKRQTSEIYSEGSRLLFLARDDISYQSACEMFPKLCVKLYPDIVTTLIGKYQFSNDRNGVLLCLRNDDEKYYNNSELERLEKLLRKKTTVDRRDTTRKGVTNKEILLQTEKYMEQEFELYSQYRVIITDRYHGTIFSLIAQTPVIILKTNDHKVVSGLNWFQDVYENAIYYAESIDEAVMLAEKLLTHPPKLVLRPYFKEEYYDHLKELIDDLIER